MLQKYYNHNMMCNCW